MRRGTLLQQTRNIGSNYETCAMLELVSGCSSSSSSWSWSWWLPSQAAHESQLAIYPSDGDAMMEFKCMHLETRDDGLEKPDSSGQQVCDAAHREIEQVSGGTSNARYLVRLNLNFLRKDGGS